MFPLDAFPHLNGGNISASMPYKNIIDNDTVLCEY